jgi:hypothetical protein
MAIWQFSNMAIQQYGNIAIWQYSNASKFKWGTQHLLTQKVLEKPFDIIIKQEDMKQ